ncbi:hypothetical protein [Bradymonas sediminis]|uniref:Uncharacterized protein n=1 Tax=Bradymonas sediminis TaxID=1548548 RepID=A0A2Z4FNG8_9DELT|nr:hypothetical protein [Bradymonas sediminis]AWV90238.1 hypothetical protein DN745_13230 [Bradymonas sediminis]TDP75793.1 hypothetical protein DFR33_103132 [Bradymonas sediminis]
MQENLPPCGLFRTTEPLEGKEQWVRAGMLVYFHNHSQQGPPLVLLPSENHNNRWIFHEKGYLIRDLAYSDTLEALKPEGFYVLEEPIYLSREEFIPEQTLVQLGYNRSADPILFLGQYEDNAIYFPDSGLKCTVEVFDLLREVEFRLPGQDIDHYH